MERLHCTMQSHGGLEQIIELTAFRKRRTFVRVLAESFGIGRASFSWPEQENAVENFLLDEDYQDSTVFKSNDESYFDLEITRYQSNELESATALCEVVFDGLEPTDELQAEKVLPESCSRLFEDCEVAAAYSHELSPWKQASEGLRSLAFGCAVHLAALPLFLAVFTTSVSGLGGISDKPIFVKLKYEITSPDDPSPASVDSPASLASLAKRSQKHEDAKILKENEQKPQTQVESRELIEPNAAEAELANEKTRIESVITPEQASPEHSLEGPRNNSQSLQDSVASMPSVASPEKRGSVKAGDAARTYKDLVLSAIHEAAYYPMAALKHKPYGQAVVCFTINKDGSIANVSIVRHAESEVLDEAALKIVHKASSKFPPIPDVLMRDQITYTVPIVFKKRS